MVEIVIGVSLTALFAIARFALLPWTGEAAPYALVFAAVAGAAVLAGWRSGLIALIFGQALTYVYATEPFGSAFPKDSEQVAGLLLATASQLLLLIIIVLYQREVDRAWSRREGQMNLLEKALREIDHRTSNNYQTVLALVLAQAKAAKEIPVREALQQVADRIRAIADAQRKLAVASQSLEEVRIAEHLQDLCEQIQRGLSRDGVLIECEFADLMVSADETVCISILVNELVTNALKHAFPDNRSGIIRVTLAPSARGIELAVADNGVGMDSRRRPGSLGMRLVDTFVRQLKAKHEIRAGESGTYHRIRIPPGKQT